MTIPARSSPLRTPEEITQAGEMDELALGPASQAFAEKLAAVVLPALVELRRRRQERERDGAA